MEACLLSTTYFGPVQWYQKLHRHEQVWMERHDSFIKQTYRNRCIIAATHGPQALTVPVTHDGASPLTHDMRISDHGNWRRHLHWNAIRSAYGESPFFEFYADDLAPFFERRWEFLIDFNEAIMEKMCELIDIHPKVTYTETYEAHPSMPDYRDAIRPKHPAPDPSFIPQRYYQVFEQKHGFLPNMSILDLLMNEGNESVFFL